MFFGAIFLETSHKSFRVLCHGRKKEAASYENEFISEKNVATEI